MLAEIPPSMAIPSRQILAFFASLISLRQSRGNDTKPGKLTEIVYGHKCFGLIYFFSEKRYLLCKDNMMKNKVKK